MIRNMSDSKPRCKFASLQVLVFSRFVGLFGYQPASTKLSLARSSHLWWKFHACVFAKKGKQLTAIKGLQNAVYRIWVVPEQSTGGSFTSPICHRMTQLMSGLTSLDFYFLAGARTYGSSMTRPSLKGPLRPLPWPWQKRPQPMWPLRWPWRKRPQPLWPLCPPTRALPPWCLQC